MCSSEGCDSFCKQEDEDEDEDEDRKQKTIAKLVDISQHHSFTIDRPKVSPVGIMKTITLLLATLLSTVAGGMFQAAAREPTGIGGNIAGSTITIPTASPVPYNESCAVGTYVLNGSSIGIYCNTNDYSNWYYDWTSIDLDVCVGNNAGSLVPYPFGNFSSSCVNCNVTWSHVDEAPHSTTYFTGYHSSVVSSVSTLFTPRWDDLYLTCSGCNAGSGTTVVPGQLALNNVLVNNDGTIGCFDANGSAQLAQPTVERVTIPRTALTTPTQTSNKTRRHD
ncbi:hypothetical protein DHEL01_v209596 [Diaporthe helianthi]|uniref:Cyanovirin-N domain-containing protein n=1 Tax=Diaporthe helianthi TaxID=158607 RepID=A0A2P5HP20_DIAHE|nr:hypothetical protein DHEL01_v209596 [Diaporthe helianthi]